VEERAGEKSKLTPRWASGRISTPDRSGIKWQAELAWLREVDGLGFGGLEVTVGYTGHYVQQAARDVMMVCGSEVMAKH